MRKAFALLLVLSLAACGGKTPEPVVPDTTEAAQPSTQAPTQAPTQETQVQLPAGTPNYFQLSVCDEAGNYKGVSAYDDGAGKITVDYQGAIRKVTTMEPAVMDQITAALAENGLVAFNGENAYEEGMASASMYVAYDSGEYLAAGYSGKIPQAFLDGYDAMDAWFQTLLADVPEYVPRPVVMGEVNPEALAELEAILEESGLEPLDMFSISDVPKDAFFGAAMGLSGDAGIVCGTSCSPMMSATAYSCVIATLEDTAKVEDVQKDFAENIDWNRWVCVSADSALIAQKGNMVLCLAASGELYSRTAFAIETGGWTILEKLTN